MSVTVRVALRVRPFNEKEKKDNLITFIPEQPQQIRVNHENRQSFTFDYVYPPAISQADVYSSCIQPLFDQFTKGYNATILAYGQTGSGKTYSMGTSDINNCDSKDQGIVPRFTKNLFHWITNQQTNIKYQVKVSFLELYHEDIIDLLSTNPASCVNIREDVFGNISWSGVHEQLVHNVADLLNCLHLGSQSRTTASTDMNSNSSRSHAIFTVTLIQQLPESVINSKFHFVDLAGSERLKKTNAKGDRAREGISINSGLLALGNVISALGDEKKKSKRSHVPYRNSKLTRLLQDSLGGNSQTLMLACVSPSDSNANETTSTLKYANRAKNITNRVIINQQLSEVDTMKVEITRLRQELKINDAFMKEVHLELDDLRAKNTVLSNLEIVAQKQIKIPAQKRSTESDEDNDDDDDDGATLIGSNSLSQDLKSCRSTSTKRKSSKKKPIGSFSLDKHKQRIRKETLFIKQMKANNEASSDPLLFTKMLSLFQSSIKEQKALVQQLEPIKSDEINIKISPPLKTNNKPSLMKQPNTFNMPQKTEEMHRLTLVVEENKSVPQLKQIAAQVKKAISLLTDNPSSMVQQLKPILNKISNICNTRATRSITTTTTKSSEIVVNDKPTRLLVNKRANIADSHRDIQRIIAFENIKSNTVCTEMLKALKQKKLTLIREQKDLLKERKSILKEFYQDDYTEQQQKQQYMDERIDVITIQVDFISEKIKLLQPSIPSNKVEKNLIEILKPLKEQDLRSLLFMIIQHDLISSNIKSQLYDLKSATLEKYQQGMIQLRRVHGDAASLNNQVLIDLLKSPIKCLSNGLILINTVKP
ncbi:P-loop containing nucleoside triphosphate hydrolase protein [Thamnidium elegans]|nr:P-loop containing nucleoside triphosphate hydrolase protein [Thamnidium elegans]